MRLLCDQNVDDRYLHAFCDADDLTAAPVREVLDERASDPDIAAYAAANGWVVFTSDRDFFGIPGPYGHIFYSQAMHPLVGDVLTAVQRIAVAYDDYAEIFEAVPGDWL